MLLPRISELKLIDSNQGYLAYVDCNIVSQFPVDTQRRIISEVAEYVSNDIRSTSTKLSTLSQVNWIMELIGQGFSLAGDSHATILKCIEIYVTWLNDKSSRPLVFRDLPDNSLILQEFIQKMVMHMSLLFQPRVTSRDSPNAPLKASTNDMTAIDGIQNHIELCRKVIHEIVMKVRSSELEFTSDTWLVIFKVWIGICDGLLSTQKYSPKKISEKGDDTDDIPALLCEGLVSHLLHVFLSLT